MSTSCSYLGNGLYAARLATLGALGADGRVSSPFGHLPVGALRQIPLMADHDNVLLGFILPRSRLESLQKFLPSQKVQGGCDIRRNHLQSQRDS